MAGHAREKTSLQALATSRFRFFFLVIIIKEACVGGLVLSKKAILGGKNANLMALAMPCHQHVAWTASTISWPCKRKVY